MPLPFLMGAASMVGGMFGRRRRGGYSRSSYGGYGRSRYRGRGGFFGRGAATYRRRRRKKRLTTSEIAELMHIKNILGKTAAANALPFYLGRGS